MIVIDTIHLQKALLVMSFDLVVLVIFLDVSLHAIL